MSLNNLLKTNIILIILALLFSSCSNDTHAKFRVVNFSPDISAIDVFDNDGLMFNDVKYGEASDYNQISTEVRKSHDIRISPTDSFAILDEQKISFTTKKIYTLFLFDFGEKAVGRLEKDDLNKAKSDRVKLRFVHASPSLKNVDVYITKPSSSISGALPTLSSKSFENVSSYLENDAGEFRIRVTLRDDTSVVADSSALELKSGGVYTIALVDSFGGGSPQKIVLIQDVK